MKKYLFLMIIISFLSFGEKKEIIVAVDEWAPFRIMNEKEYKGIDFDLWKVVEEELGITVKFERYPWGRALERMQTGQVDAMSGLAYTEERAKFYIYSKLPYYTCTTVFYTQKGLGSKINTYNDLYKLESIGYVIGSAYFDKFDTDGRLKKVEVATEGQLLKLLETKRLDSIIGTECQVDYELAKLKISNKFEKSNYRPDNAVNLYVAFSKKSKNIKLLEEINQLLLKLKEEEWSKKVEKNYF